MNPRDRAAFEADSSGALRLSHSSDRAELIGTETGVGARALLSDHAWNDRENAREEKRLRDAGEHVPPKLTPAEQSRRYLGVDGVEELLETAPKAHRGGGGGNATTGVLIFRHCDVCDRQWKRATVKAAALKGSQIIWTRVCDCPNAGFIEKPGTAQLIGAKPLRGGGGGSRGTHKPRKSGAFDRRLETIESEPRSLRQEVGMTAMTRANIAAIEKETGVNLAGLAAAIGILQSRPDANAQFALRVILGAVPDPKERRRARRQRAA